MISSGLFAMLFSIVWAIIGCGIANLFVDRRTARIAGFAFSVGVAPAWDRYDESSQLLLAEAIGTIAGLALVWFIFFREKSVVTKQTQKRVS